MASTARTQIVGALARHGRLSAREIAAQIGRPVSGLYHHIEQLERAGLVCALATRPSARRPEKVYGLISQQISARAASRTKVGRSALAKVAKRLLAAAGRSVAAALISGAAVTEGQLRDTGVRRVQVRLDRKALAQFNAELDALLERVQTQSGKGKGLELTIALAPDPKPGGIRR
ncbi:MAG: helix-turn-helix transcriptional regulator [Rhodomicrobium sp.]|nr:helix-turn-helix transcriptional regulator [Rhodomicrobium sp.]